MYLRNNEEVSRSAFWAMLKIDIADPETNEIIKGELEDARKQLVDGNEIHVGRTIDTMSTYQIAE